MAADVELFTVPVRENFDALSILLHWITVLLVLLQFAMGLAMRYAQDVPALEQILAVHRSVGAGVLIVVAIRLVWRQCFAYLPPFPSHMPRIVQRAATANEHALYALLLVQPLTGLATTLFRSRPFTILTWTIPPVVPSLPWLSKSLQTTHEIGADALLALIGLHAAAALFHRLVLRDRVLHRMLP